MSVYNSLYKNIIGEYSGKNNLARWHNIIIAPVLLLCRKEYVNLELFRLIPGLRRQTYYVTPVGSQFLSMLPGISAIYADSFMSYHGCVPMAFRCIVLFYVGVSLRESAMHTVYLSIQNNQGLSR